MTETIGMQKRSLQSKAIRLLVFCGLLFAIAAGLHAWFSPKLPVIKLEDGREVRVLQTAFGTWEDGKHDLSGTPDWRSRIRALFEGPPPQRFRLPSGSACISVWLVITKPGESFDLRAAIAALPHAGSTSRGYFWLKGKSDVVRLHVDYCSNNGLWAGDLRRLLIFDPSRDTPGFQFVVDPNEGPFPVEPFIGQTKLVEIDAKRAIKFTVANPAYQKP